MMVDLHFIDQARRDNRKPRNAITYSRLRSVLQYDRQTGIFVWIKAPRGRRLRGNVAGTLHRNGYCHIGIDGVIYKASRLAWLYMTKELPLGEIDHKNGNPSDDRFSNLRDVSRMENGRNRGRQKNNSTGYIGVHRFRNYLGVFATAEDASSVYLARAIILHGKFSRAVAEAKDGH